ncbi:MAG: hypothetical protein PHG60_01725 [Candidatus Dojkabacteria bacterium]|jgi:hypothetical protein|nr:hypothetical protein [Candidatus Dojkabacteria bacterium]
MKEISKRGLGRGRGSGKATKVCTCPKCGHTEDFTRGIPCTQKECTKCGTAMKGDLCL